MNQTYTAIIQQRGDWWIGWIEEIPGVNCQEKTREELLDTIRITLLEALELNRQEAIRVAEGGYQEIAIQLCSLRSPTPSAYGNDEHYSDISEDMVVF